MDHPLNPYTMFFFLKKPFGDYREKFPCQIFWEILRALASYGIFKNIC